MGAYNTPAAKCPYCGEWCDADWCDVGVGMVQCGPYHCWGCRASQIGPYDKKYDPLRPYVFDEETGQMIRKDAPAEGERVLTTREHETGWYEPYSPPGSSANVIHGRVVSHQVMLSAYREEFVGNILYEDKAYVENWYKNIRSPRDVSSPSMTSTSDTPPLK